MSTKQSDLTDKQAIRDLQSEYSFAIDAGEYDRLDDVFTPDAVADYGRAGFVEGVAAIKDTCRGALDPLDHHGR